MSEFIGVEASVLIRPDTTKFRQTLIAELTAATRGVVVPIPVAAGGAKAAGSVRAVAVAQKDLAVSTQAANVATVEQVSVQTAAAATAQAEALAQRKAAKAAAESAAAHAQLARGAGATGLSLLGARGATLAAGSSFLIGAAAVTLLAKSVQGAIEDEETLFRVQRILGKELGEGSKKWAGTLATSFGISDDAALKFEGAIAETLHNVGILPRQNAELSQSLVELAADMAAFAHVPVNDTLRALQLAVSGNTRSLRQYGVVIQNSEVQQRALNDTGKQSVDQLTRQELTLARVAIIQERTSNQVGSFAARSKELANQIKILSANLDHLGDVIGSVVSKPLQGLVIGFNQLFSAADRLGSINIPFLDDDGFEKALRMKKALDDLPPGLQGVQGAADGAAGGINRLGGAVAGLIGPMTAARQAALDLNAAIGGLALANTQLLRLQAGGAPLGAQLGTAQKALSAAEKAVAAADALAPRKGKATTQRAALQAELAARTQVTSIQAQLDSQNRKAVATAKKAGKTAQEIRDEQDQQLLTEQQLAQGTVEIAAAKADRNKSLVNDIKVDRAQIALIDQQIKDAQAIHDKTLRLQTIQQLTRARVSAVAQLRSDQDEQRQRVIDHRNLVRDRKEQRLDLDIQIAETNKARQAEIAARNAKIAFDLEQLKSVHGDIVRAKQLRLDIAQQRQAIKDLKKEQQSKNDDLRSLEFEFLQSVSGFAGTLLSNLLPTSSVAGTVGGGAITTPTGDIVGPAGFATAAHQRPGQDLSAAVQAKAAGRGATQSQMSALISIQRQQLNILLRLVGQRTHPEATHQRGWQGTEMLNTGW